MLHLPHYQMGQYRDESLTGHMADQGRFTGRGIVALVFSILSAFLGLAVISW